MALDLAGLRQYLLPSLVEIVMQSRPGCIAANSKASSRRARALLLRFLTPGQRAQFKRHECFEHRGQHGIYTLRLGRSYNVGFTPLPQSQKQEAVLCAIPQGAGEMPVEDIVLSQLLWLRRDEDGFWATANAGPREVSMFCRAFEHLARYPP